MRPATVSIALAMSLGAWPASAQTPATSFGPNPVLPTPESSLLPTVNIATAKGWAAGEKPTAAAGLAVSAFADGLDHPRWLYVLPNGDVLVAETNAPAKESAGVKDWAMKQVHESGRRRRRERRPHHPAARRRRRWHGRDPVGVPRGPVLAVRHGAGRQRPLRRQHRRRDALPLRDGQTEITEPGTKLTDLPAGSINHHWTKNLIASPDGSKLYVDGRLEQQRGRERARERDQPRGDPRDRSQDGPVAGVRLGAAQPQSAWPGSPSRARCGPPSTSATSSATTSSPTT